MTEQGALNGLAPGTSLAAFAGVVIAVLAAWWAISALSRRPPRRLRAAVLATFGTGMALSLLPLVPLPAPSAAAAADRLALFGGTLSGLAILVTAIILVWTVTAALIDRL